MAWMMDEWHTYHKYEMLLFDSVTFTFAGIAGTVVSVLIAFLSLLLI